MRTAPPEPNRPHFHDRHRLSEFNPGFQWWFAVFAGLQVEFVPCRRGEGAAIKRGYKRAHPGEEPRVFYRPMMSHFTAERWLEKSALNAAAAKKWGCA